MGNIWRPKTVVPDSCVNAMLPLPAKAPNPLLSSRAAIVTLSIVGLELVSTNCGATLKLSNWGKWVSAGETAVNTTNAIAEPLSKFRQLCIQQITPELFNSWPSGVSQE